MTKFISLLSTGLDSPVAAYLILKKKFTPIFLSFLTSSDQTQAMKQGIIQIVEILSKFTEGKLKVYFILHYLNLNIIKQVCERKLTCILCKRLMIRIAMRIANLEKTNFIVTGDILGEQASQTLDNIYLYNDLISNYILIRPLIGWNKLEVIELNKRLGLYDIVSHLTISCQYNPQYPETHGKLKEVQLNELKLNFSEICKESIKSAELFIF